MKLYTRVLLGVGLASVLAGHGIIVYSRRAVHAALIAQIRAQGEEEAAAIAPRLAPAIAAGDEKRLLPLLSEYLRATDGAHAFVLNDAGRVVAHSNVAEAGKIYYDPAAMTAMKSSGASAREVMLKERAMLELSVPVSDASEQAAHDDFLLGGGGAAGRKTGVGLLHVGLPLDGALATERSITGRILRVVLVLGGASALLLFVLMRRLLAPVALLVAATAKIRAGDYRGVIPVTTDDEIGALARSFNEMSAELGRTTVSKDFFNDILDSIQDQVIVTDAEGVVVLVNPAVTALLGWSRAELIGRPAASLLEGEGASFMTPSKNIASFFKTKSGEKADILFSSSPIKAADGRVTGYIGAAKDVSDLRRLEARMHQSEKLSAVGQLAAGVAHEINNPLGVILGFAQGMARQLQAGDALELPIKSIEREALRCKALVQNLLTFARTSHSDRAALDVNSTMEQAMALIQPQAKIHRVSVLTNLAKALPLVLGNKNQLEQVILNLAKNAIDAMPNGGSLTLSTELLEQSPHSWVCLRFVDDGAGIPPALQSKIFDPFFTTKPIGQGTGLGLSLVSEIVQKHSGEISVESRPGRTEFLVKLPARTGSELDCRAEAVRAEQASAAPEPKGMISHG